MPLYIVISFINSKQVKSRYGLGYYIFSIIVLIYVFILIYGPDPFGSENGLIFHVTAQKLLQYHGF